LGYTHTAVQRQEQFKYLFKNGVTTQLLDLSENFKMSFKDILITFDDISK